ncbi:mechanosensitive ion channel family protein [Haladaptatus sp. F3-133]|jgi:small conductance mechanosensitive channel|uniref:Mechanosensitive ion channel family protein n=1 Tax=Halorutilus salinus TaxID=2487751 RepID=A0A9Q4C5M4_9EURY|nr:mechanosensitive ion channel family protein [Halorutilus salinus]MCX2818829.1 mechanosensitive ion channel family protein [Halorutilus salinus]
MSQASAARDWLVNNAETAYAEAVDWLSANLPNFLLAFLIIVVGYRVSIAAKRYAGRPVYSWIGRESVASTLLRLIKLSIILLSVLLAFRVAFGFSPTSLLLTATVFSAVVGIILAPLVGDIINGVFVLSDQPYEVGDMVEIVDTGKVGFVEEVTIRYTKVFTIDNTFLVIPNSEIRKRDVVNYSAEDVRTRQTLEVSVTYESDVVKAREILVEAAQETPEVIGTQGSVRIGKGDYPLEPRPFIVEFGDHGVNLALRYWVREPYRLQMVKSKVNEKIWAKFRQEGIRIPYPHRHHVFDDTTGELDVSLDGQEETEG